jgi:hypothetical protein
MGAVVAFGATGGVGRHAVAQLLGAGQDVIAVVRDPSEGTPLANAGARVVAHDLCSTTIRGGWHAISTAPIACCSRPACITERRGAPPQKRLPREVVRGLTSSSGDEAFDVGHESRLIFMCLSCGFDSPGEASGNGLRPHSEGVTIFQRHPK